MKKYIIYPILIIATSFFGCKKFVDKLPLDTFSDEEYWTSENSLRTYNWEFYTIFVGFGTGTNGDFYFSSFSDDQANPTFQQYDKTAPASNGNWNFYNIRKADLMLERIDRVPISDEAKNHWKGIARFFRAYTYFNLVKQFGDVPYITKTLDLPDVDLIYKPRDSRAAVMDSVLADLTFATENLREKDLDNTVNKNVALALLSRVALYEGTYRKYHTELNLPDADNYLQVCKDASTKLMEAGYTLNPDYRTAYSSMDLKGNTQIIMYKEYIPGFLSHSVIGYTNSSTTMSGLTKSAVESYLCTDGLPITLSTKYEGDGSIEKLRTNRDRRLLETISDFLCYQGALVGGFSSSSGYRPAKFLQPDDPNQLAPYNSTDAPLFGLPEILLNYAEACAELSDLGKYSITQADLDKSINLLRARADVAPLEVVNNNETAVNGVIFVDPKKDAITDPEDVNNTVSSLIWEIGRERRVELMMDGFRYDDLMRWKKGWYMDNLKNPDIFLGAKVEPNDRVTLNSDGYLMVYPSSTQREFVAPKNYLSAIPTSQIALYTNGALSQNPGW